MSKKGVARPGLAPDFVRFPVQMTGEEHKAWSLLAFKEGMGLAPWIRKTVREALEAKCAGTKSATEF